MGVVRFVRNTPLYLPAIVVKINGETYKLKSNSILDIELPSSNYEVLICNEYEMFEGRSELNLNDEKISLVEVKLKNAKVHQIFILTLILAAFVFAFLVELSTLLIGLVIFVVLAAYWGVEYYNRKDYFRLIISEIENEIEER